MIVVRVASDVVTVPLALVSSALILAPLFASVATMLKLESEMAASVAASSPLTNHFTSTSGVPVNSTLKVAE